jgi:hypothetical protein
MPGTVSSEPSWAAASKYDLRRSFSAQPVELRQTARPGDFVDRGGKALAYSRQLNQAVDALFHQQVAHVTLQ